jgi:hypothetical protein
MVEMAVQGHHLMQATDEVNAEKSKAWAPVEAKEQSCIGGRESTGRTVAWHVCTCSTSEASLRDREELAGFLLFRFVSHSTLLLLVSLARLASLKSRET